MATSKVRKDSNGKPVHHKPETAYSFTYEGKRYKMPVETDAANIVDNEVWLEAYLNDDDPKANLRLAYQAYKRDPHITDEVREVLNEMPAEEFMKHIAGWFTSLGEDNASLGESTPSSEG